MGSIFGLAYCVQTTLDLFICTSSLKATSHYHF